MKRLEIKICGITRDEDAKGAIESGATALGFIFVPGKRMVTPEFAKKISKAYPTLLRVGVVQNLSEDKILELVEQGSLNALQFHGSESLEFVRKVKSRILAQTNSNLRSDSWMKTSSGSKFRLIRALDVDSNLSAALIQEWNEVCDTLLFDSPRHPSPQVQNETVVFADANSKNQRPPLNLDLLLSELKKTKSSFNFWIAGGLKPETVASALAKMTAQGFSASGVDVSSGVESSPGIKDLTQVRNFIENAKGAGHAAK